MTLHTMHEAGFPETGLPFSLAADAPPDAGFDLLALLFDELAHGVLVVNAHGRILHANRAALRELDRRTVLCGERGELKVLAPADARQFQAALAKAVHGRRGLIRLMPQEGGFALALVPLHVQAGIPCERIALYMSRAGVAESGVFGAFARSHRFTRTEEQVLSLLCQCLSTPEIAVQMKVAVSTVRSHVRSLCAKTATGGVRELVNRVAILPPIAPVSLEQLH